MLKHSKAGVLLAPALFCASVLIPIQAQAYQSVMIWPIDPVIEHDQDASAIWLENRGRKSQLFQVRAFKWEQMSGGDRFSETNEVIVTPPMIQIEPGQRQLIRVNRTMPNPAGVEQAYRVIIDEVPTDLTPTEAKEAVAANIGVRFQYRYSLPLFTYGDGLSGTSSTSSPRKNATAGTPELSWKPVTIDGKPYIQLRNTGRVHARIANVRQQQGTSEVQITSGLLGYVLPGKTVIQPAAKPLSESAPLIVQINGRSEPLALVASAAQLDGP